VLCREPITVASVVITAYNMELLWNVVFLVVVLLHLASISIQQNGWVLLGWPMTNIARSALVLKAAAKLSSWVGMGRVQYTGMDSCRVVAAGFTSILHAQ
jgi:hypothetical protein